MLKAQIPIEAQEKRIQFDGGDFKRERIINRASDLIIQEAEENRQKLETLVNKGSSVLYKAKTLFPFDFFPDEIIVDREKVSVVSKEFFSSNRIQSLIIANISDIYADISLWFGTVRILDKFYEKNSLTIKFLKKADAVNIRTIVQGLILTQKQEIDVSLIEDSELLLKLEEIGSAT